MTTSWPLFSVLFKISQNYYSKWFSVCDMPVRKVRKRCHAAGNFKSEFTHEVFVALEKFASLCVIGICRRRSRFMINTPYAKGFSIIIVLGEAASHQANKQKSLKHNEIDRKRSLRKEIINKIGQACKSMAHRVTTVLCPYRPVLPQS